MEQTDRRQFILRKLIILFYFTIKLDTHVARYSRARCSKTIGPYSCISPVSPSPVCTFYFEPRKISFHHMSKVPRASQPLHMLCNLSEDSHNRRARHRCYMAGKTGVRGNSTLCKSGGGNEYKGVSSSVKQRRSRNSHAMLNTLIIT